jgi:ankyrin repeat protein
MRAVLELCRLPQWIVNKIAPFTFDDVKEAIIKSDEEKIGKIMETSPSFNEDENVLMLAMNEGKEEIILFLIQRFSHLLDFRRRNDKGDSPLMVAIFLQKKEAFKALLPYSELKACDFFRNTPFIAAAANGDVETLQLLSELH